MNVRDNQRGNDLRMNNPEILATLSRQDTGRRHKKQHRALLNMLLLLKISLDVYALWRMNYLFLSNLDIFTFEIIASLY